MTVGCAHPRIPTTEGAFPRKSPGLSTRARLTAASPWAVVIGGALPRSPGGAFPRSPPNFSTGARVLVSDGDGKFIGGAFFDSTKEGQELSATGCRLASAAGSYRHCGIGCRGICGSDQIRAGKEPGRDLPSGRGTANCSSATKSKVTWWGLQIALHLLHGFCHYCHQGLKSASTESTMHQIGLIRLGPVREHQPNYPTEFIYTRTIWELYRCAILPLKSARPNFMANSSDTNPRSLSAIKVSGGPAQSIHPSSTNR